MHDPEAPQLRRAASTSFPLTAIRSKPSLFLEAQKADRGHLLLFEPDRLPHELARKSRAGPVFGCRILSL
jgi:hypothetical protein